MHSLFENRSLVDIQIGYERKGRQIGGDGCIHYLEIDHWSIFIKEMNEKAAKSAQFRLRHFLDLVRLFFSKNDQITETENEPLRAFESLEICSPDAS